MIGYLRLVAVFLALAVNLNAFRSCEASEHATEVVVSIDRKFTDNGWYVFHISERGMGPTGSYRRAFHFKANIQRGVAVPDKFQDYQAVMTTERAGVWQTRKEPIAGYLYLFFKEGRPYVELQLIEAWDGHPTRMSVNGIYPVQVQ
jgi:hypothetical protein